jgi:two-component system, OmpR family, phosphate regulon sensor histidine kinase PhoR
VRRFHVVFLLVAVALVVPTAFLVRRALQSVDVERRARHASVAERLFDEMERALSEFLAAEEARSFAEYAPPVEPADTAPRRPLASPALPFVVGYFQLDPDGRLELPNRNGSPATPSSPGAAAGATESERSGAAWRSGGDRQASAALERQAPGSTVDLADAASERRGQRLASLGDRKAANERAPSAYDALRSLNKGVEQRAARQAKESREYEPAAKQEGTPANPGAAAVGRRDRDGEADRFELSPMVGRLVREQRLVLYRTVVHERQGYRQGMLLDVAALGGWLRAKALAGSDLAPYVTLSFTTNSPMRDRDDERAYRHRFAEPFEAIAADLELAALPGVGGTRSIYALGAVSLLVVLAGLAALYRMVTVVVGYAEERSNFVAAVTHELRTPLTAIRMYGEMLRDGIVPSEVKRDEYYRHITAESERLTRLVNNVLELSRLENGARDTRLENGDLGAVVREAETLLLPHVERAGFSLSVDVDPAVPAARFERDALLQMLVNLVENAVKYAANGTGGREIRVTCRGAGEAVALSVRDYGPGVAARQLRRIFEPFYRGGSELTRHSQGSGIGLALVRALAEEMGARVTAHNADGGGLEVEIRFPRAAG